MTYYSIKEYVEAKSIYKQIFVRANSFGIQYFINGEWTFDPPDKPEYSKNCPLNPDKTFVI